MSAAFVGVFGLIATLLALAWGLYWKSRFHSAKAEVYQEFADTFSAMKRVHCAPRKRKRMESKAGYMSLALVDPLVRDGLYDALHEADEYWKRMSSDPERGQPQ